MTSAEPARPAVPQAREVKASVLAVQVLRLFVMLLSAPLLARFLRRGSARPGTRAPTLAGRPRRGVRPRA